MSAVSRVAVYEVFGGQNLLEFSKSELMTRFLLWRAGGQTQAAQASLISEIAPVHQTFSLA